MHTHHGGVSFSIITRNLALVFLTSFFYDLVDLHIQYLKTANLSFFMPRLLELELPVKIEVASGEPPLGNPLFEQHFQVLGVSTNPLPYFYDEKEVQKALMGQQELAVRLPTGIEQARWMTRQLAASKTAAVIAEMLYGQTDFNKLVQAAGAYFVAKDMTVFTHYHPDSMEGRFALGELQFKPRNKKELEQMVAVQSSHNKVDILMAVSVAGLGNNLQPRIVTVLDTIYSTHPEDYLPKVNRYPISALVDEITAGYKPVCGGFLPSEAELNNTLFRNRTVPDQLRTMLRGIPHIEMIREGAVQLYHEFVKNDGRGSERSANFTDQVYLWGQAKRVQQLQILGGDDKMLQELQKLQLQFNPYV